MLYYIGDHPEVLYPYMKLLGTCGCMGVPRANQYVVGYSD